MMCNKYGNRGFGMRHGGFGRRFEGGRPYKVPVNIAKNENSYELMVFAPDRVREDFKITVKDMELSITYDLKSNAADNRNWLRHEFSKTGFERTFMLDNTMDTEAIRAEYVNGILRITLPIIPGSVKPAQEVPVG